MATDKTRPVSARVPVEIADALEADAADTNSKPGVIIRGLLEARYSVVTPSARNADRRARKTNERPIQLAPEEASA